jgi:DNA-binding transcriptional ArsR family regulator
MSMTSRRDVFQAIADPTRREIIDLVAYRSLNLNAIADNFNISRSAISQQIKILTECGLIVIRKEGRERYCESKLQQLHAVSAWVEQYRERWEKQFNALDSLLENMQDTNPGKRQKQKTKKAKRK